MIISTFKRHGAETIDTPVFELKEVGLEEMFCMELPLHLTLLKQYELCE